MTKSFTVSLSNPGSNQGAASGLAVATVSADTTPLTTTITDANAAVFEISQNTDAIDEGGAPVEFTISLNDPSTNEPAEFAAGDSASVTVSVLNDSDATNGVDYDDFLMALAGAIPVDSGVVFDSTSGELTFTATSDVPFLTPITFEIAAAADDAQEGDESFTVALSDASGSIGDVTANTDPLTTIIIDNVGTNAQFVISQPMALLTTDVQVAEGGAAQFTISLVDPADPDTAAAFSAGEDAFITISVNGDADDGIDHEAVLEAIGDAVDGTTDVTFNSTSGLLTFTAANDGDSLEPINFSVDVTLDNLIEGDESFTVALSGSGSNAGAIVTSNSDPATTTITDNDRAEFDLTQEIIQETAGVAEGDTATYTLRLVGSDNESVIQAGDTATVNIAFTSGQSSVDGTLGDAITQAVTSFNMGSDAGSAGTFSFVSVTGGASGTLTFNGDGEQATPTLTFELDILDDMFIESGESFTIALSNVGGTFESQLSLSDDNNSVTTMVNSDTTDNVEAALVELRDADGTLIAEFETIQEGVDAAVASSFTDLIVRTPNGSQTYSGNVVIPNGANITLQLQGIVDGTFDGNDVGTTIEAIGAVSIGDGSGSGFSHQGDLLTGDNKVTLLDSGVSQLGETTTVALGGELEADGGVSLFPSAGTITGSGIVDADILLNAGTVSGNLTVQGEVDGSQAGNGTITAGFSPGVLTVGDVTLTTGDVFTVEVDGVAGPGAASGHDLTIVDGGDGAGGVEGTVTLNNASLLFTSATQITVPVGTVLTIIENDGDSTTDPVVGTFLDLPEGAVVISGNQLFEISYTGGGTVAVPGNDVTLTARDRARVEYESSNTSEAEDLSGAAVPTGDGPTLRVVGNLLGTTDAQRTVLIVTPEGTFSGPSTATTVDPPGTNADQGTTTLEFIIPADDYTSTTPGLFNLIQEGVVTVNDDGLVEGPEDFEIDNIGSVGAALERGNIQATIHTIEDNEFAEWSVTQASIQETDGVDEGLVATYEVALSGAFQAGENAIVTISLDDIDTDSDDYSGFLAAITGATGVNYTGPGTLVFDGVDTLTYSAGADGDSMTSFSFDLTIEDDALVEGDEDYSVVLSSPSSDTGADIRVDDDADAMTTDGENTVVTTIVDNDVAEWNMTQADMSVAEDEADGPFDDPSQAFTFTLTNGDGMTPAMLQAGEMVQIDIEISAITATIGGLSSADFQTALGDSIAAWNAANSPASGTLSFNVVSLPNPRQVQLIYTAGDLSGAPTSLTPAFDFHIEVANDSLIEGSETFQVKIDTPVSTTGADIGIVGDVADVTVTTEIIDDDTAELSLAGPVMVNEGVAGSYTISAATDGSGGAPYVLQDGETITYEILITAPGTPDAENPADFAGVSYDGNPAPTGEASFSGPNGDYVITPSLTTPGLATVQYTATTDGPIDDLIVELETLNDSLVEGDEKLHNYHPEPDQQCCSSGDDRYGQRCCHHDHQRQ